MGVLLICVILGSAMTISYWLKEIYMVIREIKKLLNNEQQ
jgi:hypothetical protein